MTAEEVVAQPSPEVDLVPVTPEAAREILSGAPPPGLAVPNDYPTEFSAGVAEGVGGEGMVGPFFISRRADGLIVGEIGGAFIDDSTVEIGYAVVGSLSGRGYATAAVAEFTRAARSHPAARRLLAHTPLDRPASGRVLSKAGFEERGQVGDEHQGERIIVREWEFSLV